MDMTFTRVYFNLHKRRLSIQEKRINASGKLVWKVVRHAKMIILKDATFKVYESGRQRVIKEKKKNVHAFITGYQISTLIQEDMQRAFYNPYKYSSFVNENEEPIHSASLALVNGNVLGYSILINK